MDNESSIPLVSSSVQHLHKQGTCKKLGVTMQPRKSIVKKPRETAPLIIISSTPVSSSKEEQSKPALVVGKVRKTQPARLYYKTFRMVKNKPTNEYPRGSFWIGERKLGAGGYGTVYLVKTWGTSSFPLQMANKLAPLEKAETLRLEAEVLSKYATDSPYIVKCYGTDITEDSNGVKIYNLFMEYCSGGSLRGRISNSLTGLPEYEVKQYTRDILRGLKHIHCNGIAHLDIKPDNILLTPMRDSKDSYVAKIADFGLCRNLFWEGEESPRVQGTYRFMSPEVVRDRILSLPADIWALGCSIVEMITARPVWKDESANTFDGILKLVDDESNGRPEIPSDMSDEGKDFLRKCFIRSVRDRWNAVMLLTHPFLTS